MMKGRKEDIPISAFAASPSAPSAPTVKSIPGHCGRSPSSMPMTGMARGIMTSLVSSLVMLIDMIILILCGSPGILFHRPQARSELERIAGRSSLRTSALDMPHKSAAASSGLLRCRKYTMPSLRLIPMRAKALVIWIVCVSWEGIAVLDFVLSPCIFFHQHYTAAPKVMACFHPHPGILQDCPCVPT
jgi:hypothetical protein